MVAAWNCFQNVNVCTNNTSISINNIIITTIQLYTTKLMGNFKIDTPSLIWPSPSHVRMSRTEAG